MKNYILVLSIMLLSCMNSYSQTMGCQELFETVTTNYDREESANCYGSSMLVKVDFYKVGNNNFAVAYIKSNIYDFKGRPYIFCGIPSMNWSYFKYNSKGSWGESYYEYISDYKCNCQ
jgi:hypothetical protein